MENIELNVSDNRKATPFYIASAEEILKIKNDRNITKHSAPDLMMQFVTLVGGTAEDIVVYEDPETKNELKGLVTETVAKAITNAANEYSAKMHGEDVKEPRADFTHMNLSWTDERATEIAAFTDRWSPSETEYAEQFWERMKQFNVDHDWFLTANSVEYAELETTCRNGSSAENIADMIWRGSLDDAGKPVVEKQEVYDAVVYVKNELDALIARSGQAEGELGRQNNFARQISLFVNGYFKTDHLHVEMMDISEGGWRTFSELTTEFENCELKSNEAYVYAGFEMDFLKRRGIAKNVDRSDPNESIDSFGSTFCKMEFDMKKLAAYDPIGVERYRKLHREKSELKEKETETIESVANISEEQDPLPSIRHRR